MHRFANPARFARLAAAITPWSAALTGLLFAVGLTLALIASPPDYQQGETVRIMYVHVPAAWMSMLVYVVVAAGSASALVWRHPLGDIVARAASPVGAGFTLLALLTGSLWGKPMWGTWWVWDARLTSVLVLFFLYLGHIALLHAFDDAARGARAAAILAVAGSINLPIIKFSVDWWNTLHQPASIMRLGGPSIHWTIQIPLWAMTIAFTLLFLALHLAAMRNELMRRRVRTLRLLQAQGARV